MTRLVASDWDPDSLQALANYAQLLGLIGLIFAVWTLRQSAEQAKQGAAASQGQFLLALDDALSQHLKIRNKINNSDWGGPVSARDRNDVRRYLAVFQHMGF